VSFSSERGGTAEKRGGTLALFLMNRGRLIGGKESGGRRHRNTEALADGGEGKEEVLGEKEGTV